MRKVLLAVILVVVLSMAGASQAQQFLVWGEDVGSGGGAVDHLGGILADGALAQLIVTTVTGSGGTPPPPLLSQPQGLNTGEAIGGFASVTGGSGGFGGFVGNIGTAPMTGESTVMYVRAFEQPSASPGTADLPSVTSDGPGGQTGLWYADQQVVQIVPDLGTGGDPSFNYQVNVEVGDWAFVAVPEPTTFVLALLGIAVVARRRSLKK